MRDLHTIDSELRLLAAVRWSIREHGGEPSSRQVDELLDERLAHLRGASEDVAVDTVAPSARCHIPPKEGLGHAPLTPAGQQVRILPGATGSTAGQSYF